MGGRKDGRTEGGYRTKNKNPTRQCGEIACFNPSAQTSDGGPPLYSVKSKSRHTSQRLSFVTYMTHDINVDKSVLQNKFGHHRMCMCVRSVGALDRLLLCACTRPKPVFLRAAAGIHCH